MPINGLMLVCLSLLVGGLGIFLMIMSLLSLQQGKEARRWKVAAGRVIRSSLEEKQVDTRYGDGMRRTEVGYQLQVEYKYRVGDETLTGQRISLVEKQYTQKSGQKALEKYPIGATVQVHFDPENPQEAVIETGTVVSSLIFMLGGIALVVVGVLIALSGN
jgi:hypothetical protein